MILVAAVAVLLQAAIKKILPHRLETASAGSVVLLFLTLGVILGRIGSQVCTICRCIGGSIRGILCRGSGVGSGVATGFSAGKKRG